MKHKVFIIGAILIVFVLGLNYFKGSEVKEMKVQNETKNETPKYALKFWDRLSQGDVSSTECQRAIEKYSQKNQHFSKSFYSYEKKRCFGFNEYYNNNGGTRAEEVIVDVVTGAELVSCVDTKIENTHTLSCKDSQNTWYWKEGDPLPYPEPWPVYIQVWKPLQEKGVE